MFRIGSGKVPKTKQLVVKAIECIRKDHQIEVLFVWAFSPKGDLAAETIARLAELPLYKREKQMEGIDCGDF